MYFSDLALSKRLERAEGHACVQHAEARRRLFPDSGAEWMECAGAYAVFDGIESPVTQTFGLGIFEELSPAALDVIEHFFLDRGAPVLHEVSPFAGVAVLGILCARNYRPVELSNVLCQPVERPTAQEQSGINVPETVDFAPGLHSRLCSGVIDFRLCWRLYELRPFRYCHLVGCGHRRENIHYIEEVQIEGRLTLAKILISRVLVHLPSQLSRRIPLAGTD